MRVAISSAVDLVAAWAGFTGAFGLALPLPFEEDEDCDFGY